jgi:hypothetical protein
MPNLSPLPDDEGAEVWATLDAAVANGTVGYTVAPPSNLGAEFEAHAEESLELVNATGDTVLEARPKA